MLRATQTAGLVYRPTCARLRARAGPVLLKRFESGTTTHAEAQIKKPVSIGRRIATGTVLIATAYAGCVLYAVRNEHFRDTFTEYVPGADEVLDRIDVLLGNEDVHKWANQAVGFGEYAKQFGQQVEGYANRAKDASIDAYDYVNDAVAKFSGSSSGSDNGQPNVVRQPIVKGVDVKAPAAAGALNAVETGEPVPVDTAAIAAKAATPNLETKKPIYSQESDKEKASKADQVKTTVDNASAKAKATADKVAIKAKGVAEKAEGKAKDAVKATKEKAASKAAPIAMANVKFDEPIVNQLAATLNELSSILNSSGLSDKGRDLVENAHAELTDLAARFNSLHEDEASIAKALSSIQSKTDNIEKGFDKYSHEATSKLSEAQKQFSESLVQKENELKSAFEKEKNKLEADLRSAFGRQLQALKSKHETELSDALVAQEIETQRRWIREIKYRVENERAGRLANLNHINTRLAALERISLDNAERLDESAKSHKLWVALQALQESLTNGKTTPFVQQLALVKDVVDGSASASLVNAVMDTIDTEVAERGIVSLSELSARFQRMRSELSKASLVTEEGGLMSHVYSSVLSRAMFRKHGLVPGDDLEATLARVEYYLNDGDLDNAARELNQLQGWPKILASDWLEEARRHLEVKQALEASTPFLAGLE
ncbi:hypothetical protein BZG36_02689 [Bifiguratus adelaidae]|uniref:MICOS complex subunit MIC60 n=1 Tax=Bifiguratus adelaidae TaxID=1938954 RepID=A0A261Y1I2_9FUNG|nr:hypothetical protein BZG36_02689 [Bifiguratus adelaidae]